MLGWSTLESTNFQADVQHPASKSLDNLVETRTLAWMLT
ncbi:hypothetical protein [Sporisorium scitamineum]|uniref:Uncharacterized protein n=1 Tax=Sporisorium scitamineum TaxID=49012 RepID=A0A0F7S8Q4_9BASI|nr:hypothetical protein [Sporisorium scitamineum]